MKWHQMRWDVWYERCITEAVVSIVIAVWCGDSGAIPAFNSNTNESLQLHIGIIDILQSYRFAKKFEHTFKSIVQDAVRFAYFISYDCTCFICQLSQLSRFPLSLIMMVLIKFSFTMVWCWCYDHGFCDGSPCLFAEYRFMAIWMLTCKSSHGLCVHL